MTSKVYAASSNQSCQLMQSEKLSSTFLGNIELTIILISFIWYPQSKFDYVANAKKNCTKKKVIPKVPIS